jgi:hypothetical protein
VSAPESVTRPDGGNSRTGGAVGNARLTGSTGVALFFLLAVEGVTVPFVRPLLSFHVFIGAMLLPPVALKLGSTGYRFVRYYTGDARYGALGPPAPLLRIMAPLVVITSVAVLVSGVALLLVGPGHGQLLTIHKLSFIVWFVAMTVHVLGHLLRAPQLAWADLRRAPSADGRQIGGVGWRRSLVVGSLIAGLAVGGYAVSQTGPWHHHGGDHVTRPGAAS